MPSPSLRVRLLPLFASLTLAACASGSSPGGTAGSGGSAAGTTGSAGTTGTAGSSAAGTQGTAGTGTAGGGGTTGAAGTGVAGTGVAGTIGTAGTTGNAGTTGTAGAGGAAGTGTAGTTGAAGAGGGAVSSDGCGMPAGQALGMYVKSMIMVSGVDAAKSPRNYYVWLPANYDPAHAYPLVFIGPGCGSDGLHGIQFQTTSGNSAIVVGLDPSTAVDPEHRQCFDSQTFPDPEVPYFDQTLKVLESKLCVDKSRVFIEGFSSGSWLASLIGCVDAGVVRGQGNASGCLQGIPAGACTKPVAYMEVHNNPDPNNSYGCGTQNRDEKIKRNGCTMPPVTTPFMPKGLVVPAGATVNCLQYMGCKPGYPVIFCTTTGVNPQHNPGDDSTTHITTSGMWDFWMSLPPPTP